jgi:hypothetical protein
LPAVPGTWCSQSETTVRAVPVVVINELGEDGYEMPASEDEDPVQALTANRADETLCMPYHPQTCGEVERFRRHPCGGRGSMDDRADDHDKCWQLSWTLSAATSSAIDHGIRNVPWLRTFVVGTIRSVSPARNNLGRGPADASSARGRRSRHYVGIPSRC